MSRGIHVFVEKPLATTADQCRTMVSVARNRGVVLAVGLVRRFFPAPRWAKHVIEGGLLGEITSFDVREGFVYNWPVRSDFMFRRETAGGGVLLDTGCHTLDLLLWWLAGTEVAAVEYRDDGFGGVEADCEIRMSMTSGVDGVVELSRTRWLRNSAVITGTRGQIEVGLRENRVSARPASLVRWRVGGWRGRNLPDPPFLEPFAQQMEDWSAAIVSGDRPFVPPEDAARSLELIERCYRERRQLSLPWVLTADCGEPRDAPQVGARRWRLGESA